MIKAIIFDCFGVLTITDTWREFWSDLKPNQVVLAREVSRKRNTGQLNEKEFIKQLSDILGRPAVEIEKEFSDPTVKNTRLIDYIKTLKEKYKIGLLSNIGSNWITDEFLTKEEQKLFDDMVLSFEHSAAKPDPKIFKLACERLNIEPQEAIFIDDIDTYVQAAENLGMQGIVYQDFTQIRRDLEKLLNTDN